MRGGAGARGALPGRGGARRPGRGGPRASRFVCRVREVTGWVSGELRAGGARRGGRRPRRVRGVGARGARPARAVARTVGRARGGDGGIRAALGPEASFVSAPRWRAGSRLLRGDSGPGGAAAWEPGPRGSARAVLGEGGARVSWTCPPRYPHAGGGARACAQAARPGRKRSRRPGSSGADGPRARGPLGGDVTVGAPATRVRCARTAARRPGPWPRAREAGDPGGGRGGRAQGGVAKRGGDEGAAGRGGDIWRLGRRGRRGGAEGKRNTSQARGRGGPSFLGRPFSQCAVSLFGLSVFKSTPGAGVRPEPCPPLGAPDWGAGWGFGRMETPSVTMRYWGAGGRGGRAPEWRPGP